MNVSFFQELLTAISDRGRQLLDLSGITSPQTETIETLCHTLLAARGDASGAALARQILVRYATLDDKARQAFFRLLADGFAPDAEQLGNAARLYLEEPGADALKRLARAVEPPRAEFLRRLNLAPGATSDIVNMRADLLGLIKGDADLAAVDADFVHLLVPWFNRCFLVLQGIDWGTPANILDKIIRSNEVDAINGWDDLRRRLDPADRRCYAFFHPALIDEPLMFLQVALTRDAPTSIAEILNASPPDMRSAPEPTTAAFYSITDCQQGLRGISFGNFLIKQVVDTLARDIPSLKTFVALMPVPGFAAWLARAKTSNILTYLDATELAILDTIGDPSWMDDETLAEELRPIVLSVAAHYFLVAKNVNARPIDPIARFHLANGARLERIHWMADLSPKGLEEAHGLMASYRYDLRDIEDNHENYANFGAVAAPKPVRSLLKVAEKSRELVPVVPLSNT